MIDDVYNGPCIRTLDMTRSGRTPDQHRNLVIMDIKELLEKKDGAYKVSPIDVLPTETWLHQIRIKAERALQAKDPEKRKDELMDCAIYCILALAKGRD